MLPCSTNNQDITISAMEIHVIPFRRHYLLQSVYFEFRRLCLATGCQCPSVACFLFSSMLHICVTRRGHIQRGTNLLVFHLQSTHREGLADPKPGSVFPKGTWRSSAAPSTAPGMPEAQTGSALCRETLLARSRKPAALKELGWLLPNISAMKDISPLHFSQPHRRSRASPHF